MEIPHDAWAVDRVPDHLRMTFRVEDAEGRILAEGIVPRELNVQMAKLLADHGYRWYGDVFDADLPYVQTYGDKKIVATVRTTAFASVAEGGE